MVGSGCNSLADNRLEAQSRLGGEGGQELSPEAVERFLSGSASKEEIRRVVRHLLALRPGSAASTQRDSRSALLALLAGGPVNQK